MGREGKREGKKGREQKELQREGKKGRDKGTSQAHPDIEVRSQDKIISINGDAAGLFEALDRYLNA